MFEINLNNSNFLIFAAKNYTSPYYIEQEFFADLKKIKYLKRLLQKYNNSGILKERLILNHLITIYNSFDHYAATRMLFLKINKNEYSQLKTFLIYLDYMPDVVQLIKNKDIYSSDISIDFNIANVLRNI
jgi:hypothetical protein